MCIDLNIFSCLSDMGYVELENLLPLYCKQIAFSL